MKGCGDERAGPGSGFSCPDYDVCRLVDVTWTWLAFLSGGLAEDALREQLSCDLHWLPWRTFRNSSVSFPDSYHSIYVHPWQLRTGERIFQLFPSAGKTKGVYVAKTNCTPQDSSLPPAPEISGLITSLPGLAHGICNYIHLYGFQGNSSDWPCKWLTANRSQLEITALFRFLHISCD